MTYRANMPCPRCRPRNRTHVNPHEHQHLVLLGPAGADGEPSSTQACVDIDMVPVLTAVWSAGIRTFMSCQGGPEPVQRAWLTLTSAADFEATIRLFDRAATASPDDRLRRMMLRTMDVAQWSDDEDFALWRWQVWPAPEYRSAGPDQTPPSAPGPAASVLDPAPVAYYGLSFPASDLAPLTLALTAAQ